MRAALSAAGISHLLAVSGLHLSILLAVCGRLGDLLLWSRRKRTLLSLLCCFAMMVLAGFRASVLRAALMAGLALGASLRGRRGDGLTGLGFAVTVILLLNPAAVWELGFLLSCGATLGILLLAKPLARLFPAAQRSRWGRLLWESASVSLAAQLGTLPIAALTFGYLPAYSLITNLLVLPLVYGTMVFAFLTLPCLAVGVGVYPFTAASCFAGGIAAKVDVSEMMGSSVHLHVSAEGKDVIIIVPTIDMKGHYAMGDTVHFSFEGNVAHVFSKETDKNLEW